MRVIRIKTTMRYHFTPTGAANIEKLTISSADKNRATGTLVHYRSGYPTGRSAWKTVCQVLKKLIILLPCNAAILLPGIYPREMKTQVHAKTCVFMVTEAWMFIIALFVKALR